MACLEQGSSVLSFSFIKSQPPLLVDLVKRYQVRWEVSPNYAVIDGRERQVGFDLELSGTHESATEHIGPGCTACRRIYHGLHSVAEWVLPKQVQPSMYRIEPGKAVLRYSAVRATACVLSVNVDVAVRLKVVQLIGLDPSHGECEMRTLRELKERLSELGTGERQWSLRMHSWRERVRGKPESYSAVVASSHLDE